MEQAVQEYQPYYAAFVRERGEGRKPYEYMQWINAKWLLFRLESAAKHGSDAERQDFAQWLGVA